MTYFLQTFLKSFIPNHMKFSYILLHVFLKFGLDYPFGINYNKHIKTNEESGKLNKGKILAITSFGLWLLLVLHLLAYEVFGFNYILFTATGILSLVATVVFHVWFMLSYFKNHKKVRDLQDQYIETLKPEKPLRFCPSDEELVKKHQEKLHQEKENKQNTNEDSFEMELE